uniref:cytochrome P450 1A1-like n=1 Tax=Styela clava TaxID=7725 RepID=UPI00193A9B64|nr:cytochrome P450 1A1-like [Styela clava]
MSETTEFRNMPGPWGWPLFGSALQLKSFAEKTLLNWANQHYGNIFRYKMFNQDCVVLNGYDAIKEGLLTNKSEMSGRITGPLFEAIRDNRGLFFIQYGDSWKNWKLFVVKSVASVMPDLPQIICEQADEFLSEDLKDFIENGESVALGDYLLYRMAQVVFLSCMNKEFLSKKKMELQELLPLIETMRLRPIAPGALYHKTISDTVVGGYKIPKDVVIHPNLWSVHHDLKYWGPDVEAFRPDRHLDKDGKFVKSDHVIPFSVGERKCIGKQIAEADIFVFLATTMLRYDV